MLSPQFYILMVNLELYRGGEYGWKMWGGVGVGVGRSCPIHPTNDMPEIGEVARAVNRLRTHLVGKSISKVTAVKDLLVYKDTTHEAFKKALEGKKVLGAKQWGKYFWYNSLSWCAFWVKPELANKHNRLAMDSPPHPIMHFGIPHSPCNPHPLLM